MWLSEISSSKSSGNKVLTETVFLLQSAQFAGVKLICDMPAFQFWWWCVVQSLRSIRGRRDVGREDSSSGLRLSAQTHKRVHIRFWPYTHDEGTYASCVLVFVIRISQHYLLKREHACTGKPHWPVMSWEVLLCSLRVSSEEGCVQIEDRTDADSIFSFEWCGVLRRVAVIISVSEGQKCDRRKQAWFWQHRSRRRMTFIRTLFRYDFKTARGCGRPSEIILMTCRSTKTGNVSSPLLNLHSFYSFWIVWHSFWAQMQARSTLSLCSIFTHSASWSWRLIDWLIVILAK